MQKKIFLLAAIIFSSRLLVLAQDSSGKTLNEIVLVTNKYPKKQIETGKVITIIHREQIERSVGKTMGELLNTIAGVTIAGADNNLGTNLTASIRGARAGNVLILVDGLPVTDPSANNNYFDLNFFSIDQVDRIEILKGGQSTLYGSDAVAGVINIITKKNEADKWSVAAHLTAGSYSTFKENIVVSGKMKRFTCSGRYSHLSSAGFSSAYDSTGNKNFNKDGFEEHVATADATWKINQFLKTKIFGTYSYYFTDLDAAAFTDEKDYTAKNKNLQTGTGLVYESGIKTFHFNYLFNYVHRNYVDDSGYRSNPYVIFSHSNYFGRTHFAEVYANWKWSLLEFLSGVDFRFNNTRQQYFSTGSFGPFIQPQLAKSMWQLSPYASLVFKKNSFSAEAGSRWNHHSEYGNNFTFTFNPYYILKNKIKFFTNFYSAFKSPTLYQLFDPSFGNKELQPEKGWVAEAGTELFSEQKIDWRLVGFYRKTKNAIDFIITNPSTFESRYRNISQQENYGMETELIYNYSKWSISANYTYTDGKTVSSYDGTGFPLGKDTTYYNLYRIPKHALNLSLALQANQKLYISSSLKTWGKREEFIYGNTPALLKSFYTINFYTEYKLREGFKLFIDLKNITNQKYFEMFGYNTKRFNFTMGIQFQLKNKIQPH